MRTTSCPNCGKTLKLPDTSPNNRVKCPNCQQIFEVTVPQKSVPPSGTPPLPTPKPNAAPSVPASPKPSAEPSVRPLAPQNVAPSLPAQRPRPSPSSVSDIPTVVALRKGPAPVARRRMHLGWIAGALIAFLAPILTASALTFWRPAMWRPALGSNAKHAYAGIEIGAKGPRYCLVEFDPMTNSGQNFRVAAYESTTADLAAELKKTGSFDQAEFLRTMQAVKKFFDRLVKDHQVPPERIAIVSSEGLFGSIGKRRDLSERERDRLIAQCRESLSTAVNQATGQTMEFVKLPQVAEHQLKAVVRKTDLTDAVLLDIGGTTRGYYSDAAAVIHATETTGIEGFMVSVKDGLPEEDDIAEWRKNFIARAKDLAELHLREPFRKDLRKDPQYLARGKVYLAGGIAWVMANCQRPDDTEDYVRLHAADIEAFTTRVRNTPDFLTKLHPPPTLASERQEWLKREYARMLSAFDTPERLIAGAEILQALSTELQFAGREIWFYRHSDFAWVASYVEETRRPRP